MDLRAPLQIVLVSYSLSNLWYTRSFDFACVRVRGTVDLAVESSFGVLTMRTSSLNNSQFGRLIRLRRMPFMRQTRLLFPVLCT